MDDGARPARKPAAEMPADTTERRLSRLLRDAQDGDAKAYQALLRDCVPLIAAKARRRGLPPDQVDDVVQETLITIHRVRATYDPRRRVLPWLHAIAERRVIDAMRRHGRRAGREVHEPTAYEAHADAGADPIEALDRGERGRTLRRAVARLSAGQRQAVERLALGEQSLEQAAAETGRDKGALKVNLHRAIRALRLSLTEATRDER